MKLTNLEKSPEYVQETINLIEKSFEYKNDQHFDIDFYPLMKKSNHKNCHILIDSDMVVAHIGELSRSFHINNTNHKVSMFGGIAVHKEYQGKGVFKKFFSDIMKLYNSSALQMLWSEKIDLYNKFNFYPAIELYEYPSSLSSTKYNIIKTKLSVLNEGDLKVLQDLYINSAEIRFHRNSEHWNELKKVSSANLYLIKENDKVINYFIKDKGADLADIIHEYGRINSDQIKTMQNYGKVWSSTLFEELPSNLLYAALIKIGDLTLFKRFIRDLYSMDIKKFSDNMIVFNFNNETYEQSINDFILGVFGPGRYHELNDAPNLFFCGLDSI